MGHSYSNVLVHVVFSTKNRAKIIPPDRQEELWRYMVGIGKNIRSMWLPLAGCPITSTC